MKVKTKQIILIIFGIICLIVSIPLIVIVNLIPTEGKMVEVPCYDKFSNEIQGIVCEEIPVINQGKMIILCFCAVILWFVSIVVFFVSCNLEDEHEMQS